MSDYVSEKRMITKVGGMEYEIQTFQGKHSNEYLLSEMKNGKVEGRCQLFKQGIICLSWTVQNGKRVGAITEYDNGKVLHKEDWNSILLKTGERRSIENTKEGLVMTIRCQVNPKTHRASAFKETIEMEEFDDTNAIVEVVIYRGGFNEQMKRHGFGIEFDMENGREKLEGYWENDKLLSIFREFDPEKNKMVEYKLENNIDLWSRIPIYVGEYCYTNGRYLRNGKGYLIDETNGTAVRESLWKNGIERRGINLYEGWYMKGMKESIRSVLKNQKPEEVENEPNEVIGDAVSIRNSEELDKINMGVSDLMVYSNSYEDVYDLRLYNFNWLRSIEIHDSCFSKIKTFELSGLSKLKSLKIDSYSFVNTESMNLSNLISLESIVIGNSCFSGVKTFVLNGLNNLKSLTVGNNSFENTESMNSSNLISLESIIIGNSCFSGVKSFVLNGLNNLKSLKIGSDSFVNTESMKLSNMMSFESIIIGDNCLRKAKSFELNGLNKLKSLIIGSNSFTETTIKRNTFNETIINVECDESKSVHIWNCESLTSIEIGSYCFSDFGGVFKLEHLNSLQSITIGKRNDERSNYSGNENSNKMFYHTSLIIHGIDSIIC